MPSLFTELRRRNVFKVGAAYAIVAWLLLQITDIVLPTFQAPLWVAQTITFLLIIGFPITLLMAWAYEMTPEGIKAAADVPGDSIAPATGQRLNYVILGLVVLAVGFLVIDQYVLDQGIRASVVGTNRPLVTAPTSIPAGPSTRIRRWAINIGETIGLGQSGQGAEVAVSPDGSRIVYAANVGDGYQLYMRPVDQFEAQPIPGTENPRHPFFSPNGEWVGFEAGQGAAARLRKVSIRGGPPQTLAEGFNRIYGVSWADDDTIVFSTTDGVSVFAGFLVSVPDSGGTFAVLTTPDPETSHIHPQVLPGSNAVLFTIRSLSGPASEGSIAVLSLETGEYRTLILGGYNARYAPTGHIIFVRGAALWAVPFDLERLEITGTESPLVEGLSVNSQLGWAPYSLSSDGLLAYVRGGDTAAAGGPLGGSRNLVWVNRDGLEQPVATEPRRYLNPRLSPDSQRLAVTIQGDIDQDVYILDLVRGTSSRLTVDPANDQRPVWTPDGQQIVYWSARGEEGGIFRRAANGTGQAERLTTSSDTQHPEAFSLDGTQLVFREFVPFNWDLRSLSFGGEPASQPLLETEFQEAFSAVSPDGRWLAYVSNETGRQEVYVRPYPNVDDDKISVSRDGGDEPLWGADGKELFYLSQTDDGDVEILMVSVTVEPTFSVGVPELLFTGDYVSGGADPNWDISADGQSFLMMTQEVEQTSIAFVDNWFEELNRLAPPSP